jgi:acyl transferase domain-containing protein
MATPITAPSGLQQQKLIEQIYHRYGVNKSKIQVIEAHGRFLLHMLMCHMIYAQK